MNKISIAYNNTIEIIETFFKDKNIKGEIYNDEWKDFGYNRTLALKISQNRYWH